MAKHRGKTSEEYVKEIDGLISAARKSARETVRCFHEIEKLVRRMKRSSERSSQHGK